MKLTYNLWIVTISLFVASLISSIIIAGIFTGLSFFFIIAIFNFIGVTILGLPVSFLIQRLVSNFKLRTPAAGLIFNVIFHALAGALIVLIYFLIKGVSLYRTFHDEQGLYVYAGLINGVIFYLMFIYLRMLVRRFLT